MAAHLYLVPDYSATCSPQASTNRSLDVADIVRLLGHLGGPRSSSRAQLAARAAAAPGSSAAPSSSAGRLRVVN